MFKKIFIEQEETSYRIYDDGRVMNEKTGTYYKGTIRNGYRWFDLRWKNKKYARSQHRLIAEAFIPNPNNYPQVNHKDENKANNNVENLEWCTAKYNLDYNDLQKRNHIKQKRKIAALSIDNNIVKEFDSASDAANYIYNTGAAVNIRSAVCNIVAAANTLQSKLRYGYIWRWQEKSKRKS